MSDNQMKLITANAFEHIREVIARALTCANRIGATVLIKDFNGINLEVHPGDNTAAAERRFDDALAARTKAYRQSDEYKKAQADLERDIRERQLRMDQLVQELPKVISRGYRSLGEWLAEYIERADRVGVNEYKDSVQRTLHDAGFYANVYINKDRKLDEADDEEFVRYIVGQMLEFFKHGMPAHPTLAVTINKRVWKSPRLDYVTQLLAEMELRNVTNAKRSDMTTQPMEFTVFDGTKRPYAVTHDGTFHVDDVTAGALLYLIDQRIEFVRTRERSVIETADIVFDVGGQIAAMRFDHHQKGAPVRDNGIPYSSAGLVFDWVMKYFSDRIVGPLEVPLLYSGTYNTFTTCDESVVRDSLEPSIVCIDAIDNGITVEHTSLSMTISTLVESYLPAGHHATSHDLLSAYIDAVVCVARLIRRHTQKAVIGHITGKLLRAVLDMHNPAQQYIIVPTVTYNDMKDILAHQNAKDILYIIYKRTDGNYAVRTVPERINTPFIAKKPLPWQWAECGDDPIALSKATGVDDAIFCHKGRFIAVAKSVDGAIRLAEQSRLTNEENSL